jgi:uncharacterized membrane protein YeaQ/YmgE (transglycosylase-associated protein family)
MNPLAWIFALVLATLIGALFFLIRPSKSYRMFGLCILVSWIGFTAGHFTAEATDFRLWMAGSLNLSGAVPGTLLALILLRVLALREWN